MHSWCLWGSPPSCQDGSLPSQEPNWPGTTAQSLQAQSLQIQEQGLSRSGLRWCLVHLDFWWRWRFSGNKRIHVSVQEDILPSCNHCRNETLFDFETNLWVQDQFYMARLPSFPRKVADNRKSEAFTCLLMSAKSWKNCLSGSSSRDSVKLSNTSIMMALSSKAPLSGSRTSSAFWLGERESTTATWWHKQRGYMNCFSLWCGKTTPVCRLSRSEYCAAVLNEDW